ncbi:hypothetical protein PAHAL_6G073300 [Panicum hallii]|uniref:BED-type domain-containing protein n=1 Tax=Panicum hallii TaxID=206008 RepID=A0A2S3I130_9POAL|nr:uncharacterized protein LOC112898057 [Panicum hallii]PAN34174.1 hypothetical protein PAHAL_6G073300 [Panicum hallii]
MNQLHGLTGHEEAATTRRQPLKSAVWGSFTRNRPAAGGPATATCGECGQILRAGSSIGTSHLRRHTGTKRCQQRAAERRRQQLTAPPPGGGDQDDHPTSPPVSVEEPFFVVDGVDIPELLDDLIGKGLANIDEQSSGADQQFGADNYVAAVPQAASSSTKWFIQKKKERKGAESKKRCAREDECGLDDLSAQADFSSREKRMLPDSAGATTATVYDHSHATNKQRAQNSLHTSDYLASSFIH